ncbi:MAG: NYN domain-containing protein [Bdellovibrionaceae bacterium]|nr:NYN domain-containing protein [Pseudobdellovibrionaceae bacterium]
MKVRLFIDFWNFQLNWNSRTNGAKCDWKALPGVLMNETQSILNSSGLEKTATLHETRVYASYERGRENSLKNWLDSFLDKQPGFTVIVKERHWRQKAIHCRNCDKQVTDCPFCKAKLGRSSEKMVDSRIVTDMLSLAWDRSFDTTILLSGDADMVPAVENLLRHNFKVINATWNGNGHELAKTSWASFELDSILSKLIRP